VPVREGHRHNLAVQRASIGVWPPPTTTGGAAASGDVQGELPGTFTREEGSTQVTYRGHPLSRFAEGVDSSDPYGRGVDGSVGGNESRFINHSTKPNIGALRENDWGIVFYSLDDIAKGEELTFNYGFDPKQIIPLRVPDRRSGRSD